VFIDALGWRLSRRYPFMPDELPFQKPLQTVFGYSSTCDPTILTGLAPRDHGHFSFFYYAPDRSPFKPLKALALLPDSVVGRGRVRHWISRIVGAAYGYTGYFQLYGIPFDRAHLFDYSEKRDLYEPGGILGGQPTVFDHLRATGVPFHRSDWRKGEAHNLQALSRDLDHGRIRFAWLYMAAMDAVLHADGTDAPSVAAKIRWYEDRVREVLKKARSRYDDVRLTVFSDHGMADVHEVSNLMAVVDALGLRFGHDYAAVFDSTMARFWFLRPGARERILDALDSEPSGRWLSDTDLAAWGVDFPDRKYGEAFFLLHPGVLLCPSHMGRFVLKGMHGYEPGHEDSVAWFASDRAPDRPPDGLADLAGLMNDAVDRVVAEGKTS
jgi:hypothetical protein